MQISRRAGRDIRSLATIETRKRAPREELDEAGNAEVRSEVLEDMGSLWSYFVALLGGIPPWIFLAPLIVLAAVWIRFWNRVVLRNVCLAISLLIVLVAIPPATARAYFQAGGGVAVERRFGGLIDADSVVKYRFAAGFGDTVEYWKVKDISADARQRIIDEYDLEKVPAHEMFPLGSTCGAPWWWPRSTTDYAIYKGDGRHDGYMGGVEIWVPKKGSAIYLYRFIE